MTLLIIAIAIVLLQCCTCSIGQYHAGIVFPNTDVNYGRKLHVGLLVSYIIQLLTCTSALSYFKMDPSCLVFSYFNTVNTIII